MSERLRLLTERYAGGRPVDAPETVTTVNLLLQQTAALLRSYVVFASDHQVVTTVLYVAHTHAIGAAEASPYLAVTSPEKRSGKTRLFDVLELLVAKPWRAVLPSEAVVYRKVHKDCPTLLLDEADAIWGKDAQHEGLRALLNAGNRRGVKVPRMAGASADMKIVEFDIFSPKAIAGIGALPDTVADRAIPIRLKRRKSSEHVERFRYREAQALAAPIRKGFEKWAESAADRLAGTRPELPVIEDDRAVDGWEPLLAIAEDAGGDWPERARLAAVMLHGSDPSRHPSIAVLLLGHIRDAFEESDQGQLTTAEILDALVDRDDGPWAEWWGKAVEDGKLKSPGHRISRILGDTFGISPVDIRTYAGTRRGYRREQFEDEWDRWLPSPLEPPKVRDNATSQVDDGASDQQRRIVAFSPPSEEGDGEDPFEGFDAMFEEEP